MYAFGISPAKWVTAPNGSLGANVGSPNRGVPSVRFELMFEYPMLCAGM